MFWLPRGHFSTRFGSQEGTLAHILAPKRELQHVFWLLRGHFSACFGSQEGSLSCFNQPRGQLSVFCQPRGTFGMLFWLPRGYFSARFGSQEGDCPPLCTSLVLDLFQPIRICLYSGRSELIPSAEGDSLHQSACYTPPPSHFAFLSVLFCQTLHLLAVLWAGDIISKSKSGFGL